MQAYVSDLEKESRKLEDQIKKVTFDLDKSQQQLRIFQKMKPAYMEEYSVIKKNFFTDFQRK